MRARRHRPLGSAAAQSCGRCGYGYTTYNYRYAIAVGVTHVSFYRTNISLYLLLILFTIVVDDDVVTSSSP